MIITPKIDPANTFGIDISHYQNDAGGIDWNQVANPPAPSVAPGFTYVKLTDGKTTDPYGITNATNAANANIPLGYYHFAYPGLNPADVEADAFYNQVAATAITPTLNNPYMLDLEKNYSLAPDDFLAWVNLFLLTFLNHFGAPPGPAVLIYGSPGNLNNWLPAGHNLGAYPLWIAEYGVAAPIVPAGWADWPVWQSTNAGTVPGFNGNVDLDQAKPGFL